MTYGTQKEFNWFKNGKWNTTSENFDVAMISWHNDIHYKDSGHNCILNNGIEQNDSNPNGNLNNDTQLKESHKNNFQLNGTYKEFNRFKNGKLNAAGETFDVAMISRRNGIHYNDSGQNYILINDIEQNDFK